MRILLDSATEPEIAPTISEMQFRQELNPRLKSYEFAGKTVDVLVSGIGMTATAAWVAKSLTEVKYSMAINAGVCGAFNRQLKLGEVVRVMADEIPNLGAEDGDEFVSAVQLKLMKPDDAPYRAAKLYAQNPESFLSFRKYSNANGITVNRVHGNDYSIAEILKRTRADVESMEGAGFYYACGLFEIPCLQIRAVSNYVERRNREAWKLSEAITNLNSALLEFLKS